MPNPITTVRNSLPEILHPIRRLGYQTLFDAGQLSLFDLCVRLGLFLGAMASCEPSGSRTDNGELK